jgi:methyl-accepting chemotaxis protein
MWRSAPRPTDRSKELATIERLAKFYADSAQPLEALILTSADATELKPMYAAIKAIEAQRGGSHPGRHRPRGPAVMPPRAPAVLWRDAKPRYAQWLAAINQLIDYEEARCRPRTRPRWTRPRVSSR